MSIKKTVLSTVAFASVATALISPINDAYAQNIEPRKNGYGCSGKPAAFYKPLQEWAKQFSLNPQKQLYVFSRIHKWDGRYIKQGCEALLAGNTWDDSCLNGRRNLEEIAESIPDNLDDLSQAELVALLQKDDANKFVNDAREFCRSNGVYR